VGGEADGAPAAGAAESAIGWDGTIRVLDKSTGWESGTDRSTCQPASTQTTATATAMIATC